MQEKLFFTEKILKMSKGFIYAIIYYVISVAVFFALTFLVEQPRHSPGFNYFFLLLIIGISVILLLINFVNVIRRHNEKSNTQSLFVHLTFLVGLFLVYMIDYYNQFR